MPQLFNPTNLNIFFTAADTSFQVGIRNADLWSSKWARVYPCSTEFALHGWQGMPDNMRIWDGARVVQDPAPQTYQVPMLPWEQTVGIDIFAWMDDQYGIYSQTARLMGSKSAKFQDYALRDLLQGNGRFGSAPFSLGPDGVSFWNTAHPVDVYDPSKGTYCNDYGTGGVSVNGVTVGGTFSTNSYASIWSDMATRKNESNEAIGVVADSLLVPPQLKFQSSVVLQSQMFAPASILTLGAGNSPTAGQPLPANAPFVGAMNNPLVGSADLTMSPDLSAQPTAFYLGAINNGTGMKPLGWALRTAPTFIVRQSGDDPIVFDQHRMLWGAWARATPHWGFAWDMSRSGI